MVSSYPGTNYVDDPAIPRWRLVDQTQRALDLLAEASALAETLLGEVWENLPGYEPVWLDREDLAGAVEQNIRLMLTAFAEQRRPAGEELAPAESLGERRAVQGVPIESVVASWHAAERMLLGRLVAGERELDAAAVTETARRLALVVDTMIDASTRAYRRTRAEVAGHFEDVGVDLVSRLAGGEPLDPSDVEDRAQLIGVEAHLPHRAAAVGMAAADPVLAARAHRIVLDHIRPRSASRVLSGTQRGMLLLVFADGPGVLEALTRAVRRPELPDDLLVGLGEPRHRLGEAGPSCQEATAALTVGRLLAEHRAVVRFERVIPEVLLVQNPLAARRLTEVALGPLLDHPALLRTVRTYLESGLSVKATATQLGVHENTVSYRLRRIVSELGLPDAAALTRSDVYLALRAVDLGDVAAAR
jgi:hypothetical protein